MSIIYTLQNVKHLGLELGLAALLLQVIFRDSFSFSVLFRAVDESSRSISKYVTHLVDLEKGRLCC